MAIANRYARALADVVSRTGEYYAVLGELRDFAAVLGQSAELRDVLKTPAVPLAEKFRMLEALLARMGASPVASNFFRVLLKHYRMALLDEIVEAYLKIANDRMGVVQVRIASASDLSEVERETLRARFQAITGRRVEVQFQIEKELMGGVLAQIGSTVYDGSVRGHLLRIRERLMAR